MLINFLPLKRGLLRGGGGGLNRGFTINAVVRG